MNRWYPSPLRCPKVSVVVVCFNQAPYLSEAIESVLAQTEPPREIILIDDGSTDDTPQVARRYPTVRYVHQPNRGLASARNHGLQIATGRYVTFLDADDRLLPTALQRGTACFREHPECAFVYGEFRNIFEDGSPAVQCLRPQVHDAYECLLQGNFIGMHGTVLYNRDVITRAGGFKERLCASEDYDLYLRLVRKHSVQGYPGVVAEYRHHDHNMSRDYTFMLRSVLGVLKEESRAIHEQKYRKAARTGIKVWKEYYGTLLLEQWNQRRSASGFLEIARLWPSGLAGTAAWRRIVSKRIRFGSFRRTQPICWQFGFVRGLPIDRYYIESFLAAHSSDICGHVLEIGDDAYSKRFGGDRRTHQDVLHVVPGFSGATMIADLAWAPHLPSVQYNSIILTSNSAICLRCTGRPRDHLSDSQTGWRRSRHASRYQSRLPPSA